MKLAASLLLVLVTTFPLAAFADLIDTADALYARRDQGYNETTLYTGPATIDSALTLYETVAQDSTHHKREEAMRKWLQAQHFRASYCTPDKDDRKLVFEEGRDRAAEWVVAYPESAILHYWLAALWGSWGELQGIMTAARKGIAGKVKEHAERAIELDSLVDHGGGYQLLGRLHFKAPKIPLILGWPSKKKALEYLEKSYAIGPDDIITMQFLAESLWERGAKDRALAMMQAILDTEELSVGVIEDARIKRAVEATLLEWTTD